MIKKIFKKFKLTFKVIPIVAVVLIVKFASHYYGWEFLSLSSLFTAIISANTFLLGFLISGVLVDYKESEKIPGDLATSMETISDECAIIYENKKADKAKDCLVHLKNLNQSIIDWFYKKEKTSAIMSKIDKFNEFFLAFEGLTQANFIARLKQEQSAIRRMITRIHTIRETSFNHAAYTIVEVITFLLTIGLIFIKLDPFYESIFFVGFVSFILVYMILLIKDIDNPFDYKQGQINYGELSDEVSLKPLLDVKERLERKI